MLVLCFLLNGLKFTYDNFFLSKNINYYYSEDEYSSYNVFSFFQKTMSQKPLLLKKMFLQTTPAILSIYRSLNEQLQNIFFMFQKSRLHGAHKNECLSKAHCFKQVDGVYGCLGFSNLLLRRHFDSFSTEKNYFLSKYMYCLFYFLKKIFHSEGFFQRLKYST